MTEQDVVKKYLGAPFLHHGRTMAGYDCLGLLIAIYADLGFIVPDFLEDYELHWSRGNKQLILEEHYRLWEKIESPSLFDIVLFKNSKGLVNHGGVCLQGERFIHCSQRVGVIVKKWSEIPWVNQFEGFYHFKEMK